MANPLENRFAAEDIAQAERYLAQEAPGEIDPRVERLVNDLIGRIADKWTLLVLELLEEKGVLRFTEIGRQVEGISQKMLTQTLRQMERDGLLTRTVHPVVPPRVDYALTPLGNSLSAAFCGVWVWAERHLDRVEAARAAFDARG
ncbi:winged helix-turn-helix transcriptional regulator [Sphingobium sp. CAP-1]|uniref:winged helix-turn-helix transcriptional regulator n=1 Tax=Sphingobium sp. CAP-1 TaxID=2676077 RepID=UPI0012BB23AD|nr:helix-turn-helix domain-containing protein [Sphingobium sp. CAP-1]QGP78970.1 MarR family transcriptional regulator [Sphingobium sp. CAP-1]